MKLITFDVEEFFHILGVSVPNDVKGNHTSLYPICSEILDLLAENETKAIFFCVGETARANPELVEEISRRGHIVGTHSMYHKLHSEMSDIEFEDDLVESISVLTEITGKAPVCYRAPGFSLTEDYLHRYTILEKHGIKLDFSIFLNGGSHGGIDERKLVSRRGSGNSYSFGAIKSYPFVKSNIAGLSLPLLGEDTSGCALNFWPSLPPISATIASLTFIREISTQSNLLLRA